MSTPALPDNYFHRHHALTLPHSEVLAALPRFSGGRALDLGCGNGRNTLLLNQHGFHVTAWDHNAASLNNLRRIIAHEQLKGIETQQVDLNQQRFNGGWNVVLSTVVMMFLHPTTIPQLITDMQASTLAGGYNLIVAAMDTEDYPCQPDFSFAFKSGELSGYYRKWHIVKYNENTGELHRKNAQGKRIVQQFATLLAQKVSVKEG